jgi:hypothetical protein
VRLLGAPELTRCKDGNPGHTVDVSPIERTMPAVHAPESRQTPSPFRGAASVSAVAKFVRHADRTFSDRYTASCRIVLFKNGGRAFHGRVFVSQLSATQTAFREQPAFAESDPAGYAYEVLLLKHGCVMCERANQAASWSCLPESGKARAPWKHTTARWFQKP